MVAVSAYAISKHEGEAVDGYSETQASEPVLSAPETVVVEQEAQEIADRVIREQLLKEIEADANTLAAIEEKTEAEPEAAIENDDLQDERFNAEVLGYKAFTKLHKDEVLFLDEYYQPVGPPFEFQDFIDKKVKSDGSVIERYLYTPGELNKAGVPEQGIPREWLDYAQALVEARYPSRDIVSRLNVVLDFKAAYEEADEPELVAGITSGEINSYDDIVSYFAEKPVRGAEHLNRMEYAQQQIEFRSEAEASRPAVPAAVQAEFRRILPGLFAHESKFNAGLSSLDGAKGLAQIMPKTWWEYTREKSFATMQEQAAEWNKVEDTIKVSLRMDDQLEVAGKLVSDNYHYLTHSAEGELSVLRDQFDTQEDFEIDMVVPLMVIAYNVGGPATGLLVAEFVQQTPKEKLLAGKDLFLQFRDFAQNSKTGQKYGVKEKAGSYVSGVYGNVAMLEEKYPQQGNDEDGQIAWNTQ
jgi:hypothetical protein